MPDQVVDKRYFYRLAKDLDVRFRIIGEEPRGEFVGRSRNISGGGMLLACEPLDVATVERLVTGQRSLACRFCLQRDEWIEAIARVTWSEGVHRIGVHFTDVTAADQERIDRFLVEHHASQGEPVGQ